MSQNQLKYKRCWNELDILFREIELDFYEEQEIVELIKQKVQGFPNDEKQKVMNFILEKYQGQAFLNQLQLQHSHQQLEETQINYREEFKNLKQKKDRINLLNLFQSEEFWKLDLLPERINTITGVLKNLNEKVFFIIIEIAEYSINNLHLSQLSFIERLLEIKYYDYRSQNDQYLIEQTIGSLLINQIYELESYISMQKQSDNNLFQQVMFNIQKKQQGSSDFQPIQQNPFGNFYELFTPNLSDRNLSQNLDQYLKETLQISSEKISQLKIQTALADFIRQGNDFDQLYFKVIIYFWGQFCDYFIQNKARIIKVMKNKEEIIQIFWKNKKGAQSQIPSFFFDRFIYFQENPEISCSIQLIEFEKKQNSIKKMIMQYFEKGFPQDIEKFDLNIWVHVQQLIYYSLNQLNINDAYLNFLLKIFWMNQQENLGISDFISIFTKEEKNILSYQKFLSNIQIASEYLKQDLLTLQIVKIYCSSNISQQYSFWIKPINYFRIFKISQLLLDRNQLSEEYPSNMNINLENFNISLAELSLEEENSIIDNWIKQMNDKSAYQSLIPFYFNIIKREESLLNFKVSIQQSFQRLKLPYKSLNVKALFQILYNNSNEELKMMLLKRYSKYNPVPFLYQNIKFDTIESEYDLFTLNHHIYYIFPECFPIINFSLSENASRYGKTSLINEVFYQEKKFEVNDDCQLNKNTIDLMFDFGFDGLRQIAIADVHGLIPSSILVNLLPLFFLWIIQINTEQELEENKIALQNLFKELQNVNPVVCFIIRNSEQSIDMDQIIQITSTQTAYILHIQDLTKHHIYASIDQQMKQVQNFLYTKIQSFNQLKDRKNFSLLLHSFCKQNIIEKINSESQLIMELKDELNNIFNKQRGFYEIEAFPIRSIEYDLKQKETEICELVVEEKYNKEKYHNLMRQVDQLIEKRKSIQPSKLIKLFLRALKTKDFYISYISFTETVLQFNSFHQNQLQEKIDQITQEIELAQSLNTKSKELKELKQKLTDNMNGIIMKTVNIEIFWREIIKQAQNNSNQIDVNIVSVAYQLIRKGEPFVLLDAEDLKINKEFITQLAFEFNINDERILIYSALGPQSSGKSTVLNRIFGCNFLTGAGSTTKGINLHLVNVSQQKEFDQAFDYILILDTQGLQSPNQLDPKFDQKISLLVMAVSNIIYLIVKGSVLKTVKDLIENCVYTLSQMKETFSSNKQLIWCFNGNSDTNNIHRFKAQLRDTISHKGATYGVGIRNSDLFSILSNENIQILESATINQRIYNKWDYYGNNDAFATCAYKKYINIQKKIATRMQAKKEEGNNLYKMKGFAQEMNKVWENIQKVPDLLDFQELIEKNQNIIMHDQFEVIWEEEKQKFVQSIFQDENFKEEISQWFRKSQRKAYQEFYIQGSIAKRIKQLQLNVKHDQKKQNINM